MTNDGTWTTIVVRAWADVGGPRIRLLRADSAGGREQRVVISIDEASATVATWLQTLDGNRGTHEQSTTRHDADAGQHQGSAGANQRRPNRRGADATGDWDVDAE